MSNTLNSTNPINIRPTDAQEPTSDLEFREKRDDYNRKNVLLWFFTGAAIVILSVLGIALLWVICTNPAIFNRILDQFINNIAFIIVSVLAVLGVNIPLTKANH